MSYYIISIILSSFLLFQIQPLIGKYILPWFGGTANVWSASLLFFQVMLTGGYAYAVWITQKLSARYRNLIHLLLLIMSLILLGVNLANWESPIFPPKTWLNFGAENPLGNILVILFVSVGIPYFLLSTNSTLVQVWFNKDFAERNPYWLYALSNAGSLIGLISYPIIVEPLFALDKQAAFWSLGYTAFALLTGYHVLRAFWAKRDDHQPQEEKTKKPAFSLRRKDVLNWIGLPALASDMLLATTSRITQEIAPIPFLWVVPLVIYLLSYIIAFSGERWYNRRLYLLFLGIVTIAYFAIIVNQNFHYVLQIIIYSAMFFVITMICHGELYRTRPAPAHLTSFYLMTSIGGAVGGITVNLIAPLIFRGYWEFESGLGITWGIALTLFMGTVKKAQITQTRTSIRVALVALIIAGIIFISNTREKTEILVLDRNFYGVMQVNSLDAENPTAHKNEFAHGKTIHGVQFQSADKKKIPTTYYSEGSGVGIALLNHPARPGNLKIGAIGLGVGTISTYGRPGDQIIFYEINPMVIEIAQSEYFSFMADSPADISTILGDARISLENELQETGSHDFDILVVDAFNSDSIPTHLLTQEAFALYSAHLNPEGIIAIHISNRHLDLRPVVWKQADEFGFSGFEFSNIDPEINEISVLPSEWIVLSKNKDFLQNPVILELGAPRSEDLPDLRLWTDDYSNIFELLR